VFDTPGEEKPLKTKREKPKPPKPRLGHLKKVGLENLPREKRGGWIRKKSMKGGGEKKTNRKKKKKMGAKPEEQNPGRGVGKGRGAGAVSGKGNYSNGGQK